MSWLKGSRDMEEAAGLLQEISPSPVQLQGSGGEGASLI